MGLKLNLVAPEPYGVRGWGEGFKKNPQLSHGRLGILPADTLHSLILEDHFVKNIQGRFSDSRIFLLGLKSSWTFRPPCAFPPLTLRQAQGFGQWLIASFVPDYSGGSVPDFLRLNGNHGVPFFWISTFE